MAQMLEFRSNFLIAAHTGRICRIRKMLLISMIKPEPAATVRNAG